MPLPRQEIEHGAGMRFPTAASTTPSCRPLRLLLAIEEVMMSLLADDGLVLCLGATSTQQHQVQIRTQQQQHEHHFGSATTAMLWVPALVWRRRRGETTCKTKSRRRAGGLVRHQGGEADGRLVAEPAELQYVLPPS
ncbi:hypothetical protein OsI_30165 [Oryza sativa Indica Group]|uniref:Uncharacterized protein n=1 Tax=Oryza sativa subsp. indica TaxID=39946 RepID=B8B9E0_ORYSI|nr:hypothetical protein OsI_30165 [Oryza sativa Indica Group]